MRVVIALPAYANVPIGGYSVQYHYASLLAARGHDVTIVFPRNLDIRRTVRSHVGTKLWAMQLRRHNRPLIGSLRLDRRVKIRLIHDLSPASLPSADILIATAWQTAEVMAEAPRRCGRKLYVVYDHEHLMTADRETRDRIEATYRLPFAKISTSSVVATTIRRCGGEPVANVPCGIDFTSFGIDTPNNQRERLTVAFPARTELFKGTADAIAAASLLRDRYGDRLRCQAFGSQKVNLPDWIQWHAYPSQAELRRLYNAQSVFMVPSHYEGWGLPGAEALASGAALVTTDNGGCLDYAVDGQTALVVPPKDPVRLAEAVAKLFDDEVLRQKLAWAGNSFVQRYSWTNAVDRLEEVLTSALAS